MLQKYQPLVTIEKGSTIDNLKLDFIEGLGKWEQFTKERKGLRYFLLNLKRSKFNQPGPFLKTSELPIPSLFEIAIQSFKVYESELHAQLIPSPKPKPSKIGCCFKDIIKIYYFIFLICILYY